MHVCFQNAMQNSAVFESYKKSQFILTHKSGNRAERDKLANSRVQTIQNMHEVREDFGQVRSYS